MTPTRARGRALGLVGIGVALLACQAQSGPTHLPSPATPPATAAVAASESAQPSAARACRGPDVDWSALPPVAQAYGKAWNERDDAARMRLLEEALTDTGAFVDSSLDEWVTGPEAIADLINQFMEPGTYFEPRAWFASDQHHGFIHLRWNFCSDDGLVFDGEDFGEVGPGGRFERVTSFFAFPDEAPRPVCPPPMGNWTGIPELARKWAATALSDSATRMALLREIFAKGGSYVDPSDAEPVVGYDALAERVGGMLWEGAFFEAAAWTEGDSHHDAMRLRWRLCDKDIPGLEGVDLVELDDAGKFLRVIGFFPWP